LRKQPEGGDSQILKGVDATGHTIGIEVMADVAYRLFEIWIKEKNDD
jgi:hypothetical protein